jgi:hydroxymethylpyrimidine pyrophosphatase-like HAD family hydrolase
METRPKTIICDIDGVIFQHCGDITKQHIVRPIVLPGVREKWREWDRQGCKLILMTGRRESVRAETIKQLTEAGFFYDELIMNVGGGVRVLINDKKEGSEEETAVAVTLNRNKGMTDVLL